MKEKNKSKGITLIALVITIIVLLILVGVSIAMLRGDNNIITKASTAKEKNNESSAREKLELTLIDLQTDKATKNEYNKEDYINERIQENDMSIDGNIVFVDEWQFEIDRNVPEIVQSLGKGEKEEQIQIKLSSSTSSDYVKSTLNIEITYTGEIERITCSGKEIEVPEKNDGKYIVTNEVANNGIYSVMAKDKNGKYNIASIKVSDLTENMNIYTAEDMNKFRDKVNNEGRTFEGKTVTLMSNINLEDLEEMQWTPIGNSEHKFSGIFDGNKHRIENLNINDTTDYKALFGNSINGTIKNLKVKDVNIQGHEYVAAVLGYGENVTLDKISIESGTITATKNNCGGVAGKVIESNITRCSNNANVTITVGEAFVFGGGIVGRMDTSKLSDCYNIGDIEVQGVKSHSSGDGARAGGIAGEALYSSELQYSYNLGTITSKGCEVESGGIAGCIANTVSIKDCFNVGQIQGNGTGERRVGNIGGFIQYAEISNCYYIANNVYGRNWSGNIFKNNQLKTADEIKTIAFDILGTNSKIWKKINNSYPIFQWE